MIDKPLVNRVANSSIKTINLEEFYPQDEIVSIDIKSFLFKELLLKEKDFRTDLKAIDWSQYQDKIVVVFCSNDAIIPVWAYMLISAYLAPFALDVFQGTTIEFLKNHYDRQLSKLDMSTYDEDRVVIKGCSEKPVPAYAYARITSLLKPFAQSIMYGEPCSMVPIFKRPRDLSKLNKK